MTGEPARGERTQELPTTLVLGSGSYRALLTSSGGGFSSWDDWCLTPWDDDPCEEQPGFRIFLRDRDDFSLAILGDGPQGRWRRLSSESAEFSGELLGLEAHILVAVRDATHAEIRRIRLRNPAASIRRMDLTSAIELAMSSAAAHAAHPVFSRLFIHTELDETERCLLARRRPRGESDLSRWVFHAADRAEGLRFETDRARFIGRGQTRERPRVLGARGELSGTVGYVLDPMLALQVPLELPAGSEREVAFVLGAAESREEAIAACRALIGIEDAPSRPSTSDTSRVSSTPRPSSASHIASVASAETRTGGGPDPLLFDNGIGGFSADGREYRIRVRYDAEHGLSLPPKPWINVIANERFGFLVSETGASNTWSGNSRERRLTPWLNDPLRDPHGEALYVRDKSTGRFWSPWPGPAPHEGEYEIIHGFGSTRCRHVTELLEQETEVTIDGRDPVKVTRLRLTNRDAKPRRFAVFSYQRLVLGGLPEVEARTIETSFDSAHSILLARNPASAAWGAGTAFGAALVPERGHTFHSADRVAFLGRGGTPRSPRFLREDRELNGRVGSGCDPAAIFQIVLEIPPQANVTCGFVLGEAEDFAAAAACVRRLRFEYEAETRHGPGAPRHQTRATPRPSWRPEVETLQIETPSRELDVMVNGWLLYQTLSCRLWGRTAYYQSGGAFGYRDQLQDAGALLQVAPSIPRKQILLHAAHQFPEGDVLHWWHAPLDRGIRTRFADDLLWLPLLTAQYLEATGETALLDERVPFVTARLLEPGEDEAFLSFGRTDADADLYDHCCLAIDRSLGTGAHGLPLFGTGDWNDGMNRVGRAGRGESVWMGFFLYEVLGSFTEVCRRREDEARVGRYTDARAKLKAALHEQAWDGAWYLRGWYDNEEPLGSCRSDECRIDALVQAWAVLSRAAPRARAEQAMESAIQQLVSERDGLIRLLAPPLQNTKNDPGYIKAYPPGIRENGGQYTHAALWFVRACAELGWTERAFRYLDLVNPICHARTPEQVQRYQVEPYVVAADVYGVDPHVGRGGWTWYTGSSGWMYRVAVESILGIQLENGTSIRVRPCIPAEWDGFTVRWNPPGTKARYEIRVENRAAAGASVPRDKDSPGPGSGVLSAELDGSPVTVDARGAAIPLLAEGRHHARVVVGVTAGE